MQINIANIPEEGLELTFSKGEGWFSTILPEKDSTNFSVRNVDVDCSVKRVLKNVTVKGSIRAGIELECCRCLAKFDLPVEEDFKYTFTQAPHTLDDEIELTYEDLDFAYFEGDIIEIDQAIAEQIILQVPIKPLCSDSCRGLCPMCGINLNKENCDHEKERIDSPFAVLKNLKIKKR
ncbi:MAG: DUF177 domain-containing protein [Deltaproteobacteria bacterium]|nr:DUF177 domain-containing protein [Deltaproteobacteria bacterium]MBN2846760.1 DUF177 domain-containing protein [Deltaproteobacteria bacterium]